MYHKPILLTFAILVIVWALSIPALMGAHPWWSGNVIVFGGPVGIVAGMLAYRRYPILTPTTLAVFAVGFFSMATIGKSGFAASYAEDRFAGQLWYFGWIATMASFSGMLAAILAFAFENKEPHGAP